MNGNLWVWSEARPKIPSLPCPRRELVREVGTGMWSVPGELPQKKLRLGGSLVRGMQPLSHQLLPCSCCGSLVDDASFLEPCFRLSSLSFWDIHMVDISERRNCRPDEPSGISNKIQLGEFSQTTCIADDQANHRSQPRDVGEAPSLPIRCPAPTGTHNVVTVSFWSGENHSASAASISDPHHFSLSVLPGTSVSAPPCRRCG